MDDELIIGIPKSQDLPEDRTGVTYILLHGSLDSFETGFCKSVYGKERAMSDKQRVIWAKIANKYLRKW